MKSTNCKKLIRMLMVMTVMLTCIISASAAGLMDSDLVSGTKNFIADATTVGTILCPTICGLMALYFAIRRGMADEQDGKMWGRRIATAIAWGVGGGLISGAIAVISSYF